MFLSLSVVFQEDISSWYRVKPTKLKSSCEVMEINKTGIYPGLTHLKSVMFRTPFRAWNWENWPVERFKQENPSEQPVWIETRIFLWFQDYMWIMRYVTCTKLLNKHCVVINLRLVRKGAVILKYYIFIKCHICEFWITLISETKITETQIFFEKSSGVYWISCMMVLKSAGGSPR